MSYPPSIKSAQNEEAFFPCLGASQKIHLFAIA